MKQVIFELKHTERLCENVFKSVFAGDTSGITNPGQFVNVKIDGLYLRRPISVCDKEEGALTLVYKVVGKGTAALSEAKPGAKFDVLTGLGNGYDLSLSGNAPLLVGGGVGVPPLYYLAKKLIEKRAKPFVALGFNRKEEVFFQKEFEALGAKVALATVDGSQGVKGFVTNVLPENYSYFYACGPEPMLKALYNATTSEGELSFEERMGCGFGACMGCSCKTIAGNKRICKDGPVLKKGEILW
ncbi:MAG: dihydroorotate dehydrogenase electron transfer subunit [Clostridia bacterium]|nr:dihydroorotate dehydrogenase electron transfer subunit [Clostridia bacterium]